MHFTILILASALAELVTVTLIVGIVFCQFKCVGPTFQRYEIPVSGFWLHTCKAKLFHAHQITDLLLLLLLAQLLGFPIHVNIYD